MNEPKENLIADAVVDAVRKHLPYGAVDNVYWGAMWQEIRREARSHLSAALAAAQEREAKLIKALEEISVYDLECKDPLAASTVRQRAMAALSQSSQAPAAEPVEWVGQVEMEEVMMLWLKENGWCREHAQEIAAGWAVKFKDLYNGAFNKGMEVERRKHVAPAQGEPVSQAIAGFKLVPIEPKPDCCNEGLTEECCGNGACSYLQDLRLAEKSWKLAAAPSQGEPAVPEGYCLALIEPTREMEQAGAAAGREYMLETGGNSPRVIYQAMLAASSMPERKKK